MLTTTTHVARATLIVLAAVVAAVLLGSCSSGSSGGGTTVTPLSITTQSLPDAQVNHAYTGTLAATGGTAPYTWALTAGVLPPGLSLDTSSGVISGTPIGGANGATLTFRVSDSASPAVTSTTTLTLTVLAQGLSVTTRSLPDAHLGVAYDATLTATGGVAPYSWTLTSGALPAGLQLNAASGAITGTPTVQSAGTALTFKVTDSASPAATVSVNLSLAVTEAQIVISTTSLPDGQIGVPYSTTLSASGGSGALTWTLTAGALPAGLNLDAASGVIAGTPTATAAQLPLTFTVTDAGTPAQSQSAAYTLTISPAGISVSISPRRAGVTVGQTLILTASTSDLAGVSWSVTPAGGSFSSGTSQNGANVTFTAPTSAGVYTLSATSITDTGRSASITVGVTDLAGVYTHHNDLTRAGANTQEYALTPANVNTATFGKLFSCTVNGAIYAQPLWVANLNFAGVRHNVVFVATQHDGLYAFDADASTCQLLWQQNLIDTTHGATAGERTVPAGASGFLVGAGYGDVAPEVGITSTPVIDPAAGILYVVTKSVDAGGTIFYQRLHAIDLVSGSERAGSPTVLAPTYHGDNGGLINFVSRQQLQRAGLALAGGTIYIAWGAHEDVLPWSGWLAGYTYNGSAFTQKSVLNVAPNTQEAGIWMSGGAPSVDAAGHLYVITGNGTFDAANSSGPTDDYGDSLLQITPGTGQAGLGVSSFFAPTDQAADDANDKDVGAGGAALVLNLASGTAPQHLIVGGGKDGGLYVLDGDHMGGLGDSHAWQLLSLGQPIFSTAAFWNNMLYIAPVDGQLQAYAFNPGTKKFTTPAASKSATTFMFPGATPSVSASSATANGIVWAINSHNYCTPQSGGCGPAQLHAYAATGVGTELWNSTMIGADSAGNAVKFTVPTIANGKVYIGTRGNNTGDADSSTSRPGELDVYGLKSN